MTSDEPPLPAGQAGVNRLSLAIIGAGSYAAGVAHAIKSLLEIEIVGVSDRNPAAAEQLARQLGVPAYNDNRSILAQGRPQAAYVAVPPTALAETIRACAERGIHVWQEAPLARTLNEAIALVDRMAVASLVHMVGTQRRLAASYRQAKLWLKRVGPAFLGRASYLFNWGGQLGWRGDRESGGGALIEPGYHCLDLLIWTLGLPQDVFGACARGNRPAAVTADNPLPIYDTEDTVAAIFRYGKQCLATFTASRSTGPAREGLAIHGQLGSLTADAEHCTLRDADGNVLEQISDEPSPQAVHRRQAQAFAKAVLAKAKSYECCARANLLTLAVIDALYLSDRTGQPESPSRLLKTHNLDVNELLAANALRIDD